MTSASSTWPSTRTAYTSCGASGPISRGDDRDVAGLQQARDAPHSALAESIRERAHEAQGSEWLKVVFVDDLDPGHEVPRNRRHYVADSRAIDRLVILEAKRDTMHPAVVGARAGACLLAGHAAVP